MATLYERSSINLNDPRAQRSMAALQDALIELIETKPLDQITIKEITAVAGVSYPTFFRRCAGKAELLNSIATEEVKKLLSLGQQAVQAGGNGASSISMFEYVESRRKLWKTLLTGGATAAIREEFMRLSKTIANTAHNLKPAAPIELVVPLITSGIVEILTWWLVQPEGCPAERVARYYEEFVVTPIMAHE